MKYIRNAIIIILIISVFSGCKKFIEVAPPPDKIVTEIAFSDDKTATATVNGLYGKMVVSNQYLNSFGMTLYPGLSAGEFYNTNPSTTYGPYSTNSLTPTSNNINNIWQNAYQFIFHANSCIEGIAASTTLTDSVRKRLTGEVKFIRAFCYFYLSNLYNDIPLVLSTSFHMNASLPRASVAAIRSQVITDLEDAITLLPESYITSGRARINKSCAKAFLARVYLYDSNWIKAVQLSSEVIASSTYSLVTLGNVFLATSNETIWQLSSVGLSFNTAEGNAFIPASSTTLPAFSLSTFLLNDFETGDNRRTSWISKNTVGGQNYYYPAKYKVRTGATAIESPIYLRLAEQYLIRAEANAQLNILSGAIADINIIRSRAGLPNTNASTQQAVLAVLEKERRIEFFAEWGHRWFDLSRTGRAQAILGIEKAPNWEPTDILYPIPFDQISLNPSLTQNPGY